MSNMKRVLDRAEDFYTRLQAASKAGMTPDQRAWFETEYALIVAQLAPLGGGLNPDPSFTKLVDDIGQA